MIKKILFQKLLTLAISCVMFFSLSANVFAATTIEEPHFVINGDTVIHVSENYENPETGEYFRWIANDTMRNPNVAKTFEFKIQYSLSSSKFTVDSTSVKVETSAEIQDKWGNTQSGYDGHEYTVKLTGVYSRNLKFAVGGIQSGTISGLSKGGSYKVTIINNDDINDAHYLVGYGSIINL